MISIINYNLGNLNNVLKAFTDFGFDAQIINEPGKLKNADGVVLPGVGAFGDAMDTMNSTGFSDGVKEYIKTGKPFLGICLGLQLLFEQSWEFGLNKGLGIIKGRVEKFSDTDLKVPHIGWNSCVIQKKSELLSEIPDQTYFYFVHSYYVVPEEKNVILTKTNYGIDFVSAIEYNNIIATQFHIEKSQTNGLKIIKKFGEMCVNYTSY